MSRPGFNGSRPGGLRKSPLSQEEQTIQEWNERMNRLNSNLASIGEMPIQNISGNSYAGGGMGFAGMYQYTGSKHSSNLSSPVTSFNKMQPTRFERWATKANVPNTATNFEKLYISPSVIKEIQECFARADFKSQDGYLDVEELKGFMACRNYPITHWEAKKLLKNADPAYEKFISLDQIMFLVFHCGLTTPQEKPSDSIEFQNSLRELANVGIPRTTQDENFHATLPQRGNNRHSVPHNYGGNSFSPHPQSFYPSPNSQSQSHFPMNYRRLIQPDKDSILTENIEMENARSLFEQMARQEEKKKIHETQYKAYREGLRNGSVVKESSTTPKNSGFGYNNFNMPQEYYEPTKWDPHPQVVEPESGYEDDNAELNLDYSSVKANWEEQLSRAREVAEGDTWKQIQKQKSQLKSRNLILDETQPLSSSNTEIEPGNESEIQEDKDNHQVRKIPAALFKSLEINQLRADLKETNKKTNKELGSKIKEAHQSSASQEDEFLNNFQAIKGAVGNQLARIFSERRPIPCPAMKGACSKDSLNKPEKKEIGAKSKSVKQNYIMNTDEREAIKKSGILHSLELDKESSETDILFKSKISQSASKQEI